MSHRPDAALAAARYYRDRFGWNVLPSRSDVKGPALKSFAEYWDEPIPMGVFSGWTGTNLQLMCGSRWGLVVVDLDGPRAIRIWERITTQRCTPQTWVVETGSGGRHWYFTVPTGSANSTIESGAIWKSVGRHSAIEILGDRKLVIAPPSIHVDTKRRYRFLVGPKQLPSPAPLPDWIAALPRLKPRPVERPAVPAYSGPAVSVDGSYSTRAVMDAIPPVDKVELARQYGLRLAGRPNAAGWIACHAIDREDSNPSAGFNPESGYYYDHGRRERMSLFELGAVSGRYASWKDCCNDLGRTYNVATPIS